MNARGPSFGVRARLVRLTWNCAWFLLAAWTPRQCNAWRLILLRWFGAKVSARASVRSSVRIWDPANLVMEDRSTLGPDVICYNMAPISLGWGALVSQRAQLCTGSHDIHDREFTLITKPIKIGRNAWIAANAFVGPGVQVGEGAVLGACAVAFSNLEPWTVYVGNPARSVRERRAPHDALNQIT